MMGGVRVKQRKWLVLLIGILLVFPVSVSAADYGDSVPDSWTTGQYFGWISQYRFTPNAPLCAVTVPVGCVTLSSSEYVADSSKSVNLSFSYNTWYWSVGTWSITAPDGTTNSVTNSASTVDCGVYFSGLWVTCSSIPSLTITNWCCDSEGSGYYTVSGLFPRGATILEWTKSGYHSIPALVGTNPISFITGSRVYLDQGDFYTSPHGLGYPSVNDRYVALHYMDSSNYFGYYVVGLPADYTAGSSLITGFDSTMSSWLDNVSVASIVDSNVKSFVISAYDMIYSKLNFDISSLSFLVVPVSIGARVVSTIDPIIDLSLFVSLMSVTILLYTFGWLYSMWRVVKGFVL